MRGQILSDCSGMLRKYTFDVRLNLHNLMHVVSERVTRHCFIKDSKICEKGIKIHKNVVIPRCETLQKQNAGEMIAHILFNLFQ